MAERRAHGGTLVLGGGFAGSYVARLLGERGATIVSPDNFMLFTPLLPEAASGTIEPRHCVVPLRAMCPHAELLLGRLSALDTEARVATVATDRGATTVAYDDIVLALGAVARTLPIPALAELADLVEDARRYYGDLPAPRWVLVDAAPKILPQLPERLSSYATRELTRRGIEIRLSTRLERAEADAVVLSDGETIPTETL